jgi:invasion protein IalB
MVMFMRSRLAVFLSLFLVPLLLGNTSEEASAQNADASVETLQFEDWVLRCVTAEKQNCLMLHEGIAEQNGKKVRVMTVSLDQERLRLTVPEGFDLTQGMVLQAGGAEWVIPYKVCAQKVCAGGADMDGDMIKAFRKGDQAKVVLTGLKGNKVTLTLSLRGFSKAYAEMQAR